METVKVLPNGTELNVMGGAACKDVDYSENVEIVIKMPRYAYDDLIKNRNRFGGSRIYDVILDGTVLPKGHGRLTNPEWIDFLSEQFDISRTSAKEMLHVMMSVKKEDNFKKLFSQGKKGFSQGFSQG